MIMSNTEKATLTRCAISGAVSTMAEFQLWEYTHFKIILFHDNFSKTNLLMNIIWHTFQSYTEATKTDFEVRLFGGKMLFQKVKLILSYETQLLCDLGKFEKKHGGHATEFHRNLFMSFDFQDSVMWHFRAQSSRATATAWLEHSVGPEEQDEQSESLTPNASNFTDLKLNENHWDVLTQAWFK